MEGAEEYCLDHLLTCTGDRQKTLGVSLTLFTHLSISCGARVPRYAFLPPVYPFFQGPSGRKLFPADAKRVGSFPPSYTLAFFPPFNSDDTAGRAEL